ncbi:MAG: PAS domain S-box protein [bacterium]|nr:PAS domain S-box protein [bacterium]
MNLYISDPLTHEMLYANKALVDSFGSFSKKKCYNYLHNNDSPCSFCSNENIFGENLGKTHTREFRNSGSNRRHRCLEKAIKWPDGRMVRCGITADIDDMKRDEEEFRSIFEHASLGMATVDLTGQFIQINNAFSEMLGYVESELVGSPFLDIVAPDDVEFVKDSCKDFHVGSDDSIQFERRVTAKGDQIIWVNMHVAAIKDDEGKIVRFIAQVYNVTDRKIAEENLLKSEERYALIIEGASDGIWDRDLVNNEVYFSPRWKNILGYKDEEFPNEINRLYEIVHPVDLEMMKGAIKDHLSGNSSHYMCEFRIRHKDGSYRWVLARGATKRDNAGNPVRFAGSHTDITERKLMEEELLKGQRLESIGVLAGGIAHDFNNILTGVITNLEVAKDCLSEQEKVDKNIIKSLNYAESAAMRAADLTRQLLTFSKGGAPVMERVSVGELLVETASFVLRGSNVRRRCRISDDLWSVKIDENQISQVINNLVINAKQAMPDGGTVTIWAENVYIDKGRLPSLSAGRYIKITIKDRGCGIPERNLLKIFDPYFTTKSQGSGLGLATSYTIIKRHMGHIIVESDEDSGTEFKVYLPATNEVDFKKEEKHVMDYRGFGRVLLLEDEDIVATSVGMIASSAGYELEHARDGKEAVQFYRSAMKKGNSFDVVMMDLTIAGGMGGVETIKRLKRIDPLIKAIVCSGYSDDDVMANYGEYGFCGVLPKPFTKDQVLEKWANVIKGKAKGTLSNS